MANRCINMELSQPPAEDSHRLLIISPVRNEAKHIGCVVRAMEEQTRPPDLWLVADDSSDDDTLQILQEHEKVVSFLKVIQVPPFTQGVGPDRLARALPPRAFNRALAQVKWKDFTHLGKLDGDVELPPEYFERVLLEMRRNPQLGITGGSIIEPSGPRGSWRRVTAPKHHVHGAMRLFTKECFEAVGGIQERPGWDTIDETYARMRGFHTERYRDLVARHHRPVGSADGKIRGRRRAGECAYIARYSLPWILARSLKMAVSFKPRGISGGAFVWGYVSCMIRKADRIEDDEFKLFVRAEHRRRFWRALRVQRGFG